ncbi:hypothetical protein ABFS83_05G052800 [Erythranthe nasuta]
MKPQSHPSPSLQPKGAVDRISELPEDILQRILYFLPQRDAVRTSILSKSWRYNWRTRPNLDFSDNTFFKGNPKKLLSVVDKNLQLYRDQNMGLVEFSLCIHTCYSDNNEPAPFLEKWIPLLTTMGVKKFRLSIHSEYRKWVLVELPRIVFGEESLQELHVQGFVLEKAAIERIALSKNLKKLRLEHVYVKDDTLQTIIIVYPTSLETIEISHSNIPFHKGSDFRNLSELHLSGVESSLDNLSSCEFPSLKRFTLRYCYTLIESRISIDAPNLVYFEYLGSVIPSISFATTSTQCSTHLYVFPKGDHSASWLLKLRTLLESLSQFNICLDINYKFCNHFRGVCEQLIIHDNVHLALDDGCNKPIAVESLLLNCDLCRFSTLLKGLFRICRPKNFGNICFMRWGMKVTELVWHVLTKRESGEQDQFKHELWLLDLEQASLEIEDKNREGWRPITVSELANNKKLNYERTRFALKWRQTLL